MKQRQYTFNFKNGPITVWAFACEEAKILARAEAINKGWDSQIIEAKDWKVKNPIDLLHIDRALMALIEMEDDDSFDEQLDCIEALKKLRTKLKNKENSK